MADNKLRMSVKGDGAGLTPLQKRFLESGVSGFTYRGIIELLVECPDSPRGRMRALVTKVAKKYKTPRELVYADEAELKEIGITSGAMINIKLVRDVAKEVLREGLIDKTVYDCPANIFEYLVYSMRDLKNEVLKVIYFDIRSRILDIEDVVDGDAKSIAVNFRTVQEHVINHGAHSIIFVHNHTSGNPAPSISDKRLTRDLVFMGIILQIKVLDHIIIGEDTYFSFAEDGLIVEYEDNFQNLKIRSGINSPTGSYGNAYKPYNMVK